jgi:sodium/bile acid cotransporter 7
MSPKALLSRLPVDPYIVAIVGMVCLASGLPAYGSGTIVARYATNAAIALLFFLHGARLSPQAALAGASHWRLHIVVLASTFVLFPALGLGAKALFPRLLTPPLWTGVILLCALPSTVQSSIAFTSIARGNVPTALCAATASNLLGALVRTAWTQHSRWRIGRTTELTSADENGRTSRAGTLTKRSSCSGRIQVVVATP